MLDWAAYLEHLQSILLEYDPVGAPTKPTILRYFREGLKPSVFAELKLQDLELESFDQIVKKAVNVEAKSALRPRFSTKKMDQNCLRGNQLGNSTVAKSQGSAMKDLWTEELKVQGTEVQSGPQHSESSEKAQKEKKKEQYQRDWERRKGSTSASGINTAQTRELYQKKKKKRTDKALRDTSQVKYYNCQKLGYYTNKCPEPKN